MRPPAVDPDSQGSARSGVIREPDSETAAVIEMQRRSSGRKALIRCRQAWGRARARPPPATVVRVRVDLPVNVVDGARAGMKVRSGGELLGPLAHL